MIIKKSMIFCFVMALVLMISGTAAAGTFTVNNSTGPVADFTSIQAAVDAALDGDIILVYPGVYEENVDVNKELTIKSYSGNPDDTIVQAAVSNDHVFHVNKDNVTINGLTATGTNQAPIPGIYLDGVHHNNISDNKLSSNFDGISLRDSRNNTLTNNTVSNNSGSGGIILRGSSNNTLTNNTVLNNSNTGIWLFSSSDNTLISNTVDSNNDYGIGLYNSNDSTLISNTVSNNSNTGIWLFSSSDNTLISNTVDSNNDYGIWLYSSSNNTLNNNTVSNNRDSGIWLHYSSNNLIYNNHFSNSVNTGFSENNTSNVWNTTKTAGTNIIGGPFLGGNYWATPAGDGFSQTNLDTNGDGFCDSPLSEYELDVNNIDYLPLCLITHNPYDENEDYVIDIGELSAAIDDYRTHGPTSIADVSELIDMYRTGEPYC